jgi:acyl-CoA synthetase (AMP-forming)/AMP-acid ligase II
MHEILTCIRFKDMIIRGGENIAPAAIEVILNQFPGVEV